MKPPALLHESEYDGRPPPGWDLFEGLLVTAPPPPQTGLYHDQRNYSSLTKTKATPPTSTSTYRPRVGRQHFDICMVWRVGHKRRGGSLSTFWFMQFYTHIYLYIYKYRYSHRRDSLVQYYTVLLDLYYWTLTTGPLLLTHCLS